MTYMGSKNRIAKHILPIMLEDAEKHNITTWVEPFVGGGNMIDKVPSKFTRHGYDANPHTIFAMKDIRDIPNELPDNVTEEEYKSYKGLPPQSITSWVRFNCSFGGKFDGGFARGRRDSKSAIKRGYVRNYASESKRNAIKQSSYLQDVLLSVLDYKDLEVEGSLIYCDPPYQSTTGYEVESFCHEHFFEWCRSMAKRGNLVYVSEYNAPDDFIEVWEGEIKTNFASNREKATHDATEKLFKVVA